MKTIFSLLMGCFAYTKLSDARPKIHAYPRTYVTLFHKKCSVLELLAHHIMASLFNTIDLGLILGFHGAVNIIMLVVYSNRSITKNIGSTNIIVDNSFVNFSVSNDTARAYWELKC
ncbi:hypothetical protein ACJX0J_015878 [Zea mays]